MSVANKVLNEEGWTTLNVCVQIVLLYLFSFQCVNCDIVKVHDSTTP